MHLNPHSAVPPRSVTHTQLVGRATQALAATTNPPERKRMLTHLLDNTLRPQKAFQFRFAVGSTF